MSVTTIADEKLDSAKQHIAAAIEDLSEIVVKKCSGYDEYKTEYWNVMKNVFTNLMDMRDDLN